MSEDTKVAWIWAVAITIMIVTLIYLLSSCNMQNTKVEAEYAKACVTAGKIYTPAGSNNSIGICSTTVVNIVTK